MHVSASDTALVLTGPRNGFLLEPGVIWGKGGVPA